MEPVGNSPSNVLDDRHQYMPTPAEIAEACLAIQAGWSDSERALRGRGVAINRDVKAGVKVKQNALAALKVRLEKQRAG
jgi:hypothetical protein